uniref:Uncharacterized protein n=1 Tax=Globodera pallida TaxID=36090 RepID=A0A183BQS2_GLOPA
MRWALKPYNDSMEAYILLSIPDEERFVAESDGETDQKLQWRSLRDSNGDHSASTKNKKSSLTANANDSTGPKVIKAEVTECFEELCQLLAKALSKCTKCNRRHGKIIERVHRRDGRLGFMPKPSRNGIPGNRVEQYLNKLGQQSLLNSYAKKQRKIELLEQQKQRRPYGMLHFKCFKLEVLL